MIDPNRIPDAIALDTGVMIRALGQRTDHQGKLCEELLRIAVAHGRRVLLPAPALAEIVRRDAGSPMRAPGIVVGAFDEMAALAIGKYCPVARLNEFKREPEKSKGALKFDVMIVATAWRHRVNAIVTLGPDVKRIAAKFDLESVEPKDFESPQSGFDYE